MNQRQQLEQWTTVVADTGDLDMIAALQPQDATTNPSLLLKAAQDERYQHLLADAQALAAKLGHAGQLDWISDCYACLAGSAILERIEGLVSTEVDARLSFDSQATVEKGRRLIGIYRELGISRERILIKIAATWEGIKAAEVLEQEGIGCNITLVFNQTQALAAAEAGATLISPFVGRIYDWYLKRGVEINTVDQDPGVVSVRDIYNTFKQRGLDTVVMGASFRTAEQVIALAGCDKLTISPGLLEQLADQASPISCQLIDDGQRDTHWSPTDQAEFRWHMNEDPMASDLLADGIRRFAADQRDLETLLTETVHHEMARSLA